LHFNFLENFRNEHSVALVIVLIVSIILRYFFENKIKNYQKHIRKLEHIVTAYQQFIIVTIEDVLRDVFAQLKLGESDRVTLFLYSSTTNRFYFAGRYSAAPKYNKQGRTVIENEKEYVYKVLNEESEKHYKEAPAIKNGLIKNRIMESKSMYGVPIWDGDHSLKIGVLIFQSTKENAYRNKDKRRALQNEAKTIEQLINDMKINPSILPTDTKPLKGL
jgi:hypothetical protein